MEDQQFLDLTEKLARVDLDLNGMLTLMTLRWQDGTLGTHLPRIKQKLQQIESTLHASIESIPDKEK